MNEIIEQYPKECLRFIVISAFFIWQSIAAVVGIVIYILLSRRVSWLFTLSIGCVLSVIAILLQPRFIHEGLILNFAFWKIMLTNGLGSSLMFAYRNTWNYIAALPILIAGILDAINLIPTNPHHAILSKLQKGIYDQTETEISEEKVKAALDKLDDNDHDGTVLGVSKITGNYVVIPDRDINQVALVLGTTGGGKTITLRRFYKRAISKGYPLIMIDGKPDEDNINWLMALAEKHGRKFIGFNCGNNYSYDPLANGGYTELKDKIISLKDEWSNDYYRSIAEDYLQTTFEVLLKSKRPFDLKTVVECLNYENLIELAREMQDTNLLKRVVGLEYYDRKDITGLQAHLNILIHSELGAFFEISDRTFNLHDAILQNAVLYFSLPALRFPSFSKVLGKLVINDLKAVIDRGVYIGKPLFTVFDEFSVFAGDQVLNLVNMGRGKGVHAIFGTQGLADLDKIDVTFKNQILNCVNTLICHRLNDHESAENVTSWIGTQDCFDVTAQLNTKQSNSGMGSVRRNKEFIIHPDEIKQGLRMGEVFYVTKVGSFKKNKICIKFS